ncbi:hypothetical protein [Dyadobacter sp. CY326]|uniref:hypothetical protein n=1 Tax=Dyadobacter sp. CY326 TaxID=2907300 RepID=UPI001F42160F|nr:hypothetical protein [Dyadobacter sp. CY326]MCE7066654.1 hypothetical protein [Dyadobacter sp. CY326]
MKQLILFANLLFVLGTSVSKSCSSQVPTTPDSLRIENLLFKLSILNDKRTGTSIIEEGANLYISLSITNLGKQEEKLWNWDYPLTSSDFFTVYRVDTVKRDTINLGKSFELSANTKDLIRQRIPPNSELLYLVAWLPAGQFTMPLSDNKAQPLRRYKSVEPPKEKLKIGKYFTTVRIELNGKSQILSKVFHVK